MRKNNFLYITLILAGVIFFSANTGLCVEDIAQHVPAAAAQVQAKTGGVQLTISKFIVTMMGVLISSIVIWGGLSVYNKLFVSNKKVELSPEDDILNTPKTVEDAVTFFIKRNRLK